MLFDALVRIYEQKGGKPGSFDRGLFDSVFSTFDSAVTDATAKEAAVSDGFADKLRHSAAVFSAFKVHKAQADMARLLRDSNGNLKPFEQWSNDVLPIASHQFGPWLRTEYNTAVLRAQQAADWQRFEHYKDILPNLRWVPSTSVKPGADHMVFWGTVLPIDHPFWSSHRPGDRWNCKCSLAATDEPPTKSPAENEVPLSSAPQRGLKDNPGRSGNLFDQSHPYFPTDCSACPFNSGFKNRLTSVFHNRKKDCANCAKINKYLPKVDASSFVQKNKYANGGELMIHQQVDKKKADYKAIVNIAQHFAKNGEVVRITPSVHRKSEEYKQIYAPLIGTKYEGKCPDFKVGDRFYEFESFVRPWSKKKVGRMLSHGMIQSPYIVIDNTKGCSNRFLRKAIVARLNNNGDIREVYIYEKGLTRLFFKDGMFYK